MKKAVLREKLKAAMLEETVKEEKQPAIKKTVKKSLKKSDK